MKERTKDSNCKEPFIVFSIAGGIGKNIMATAVITSIKTQYPKHKIIIVTAWPEVFLNNPKVYRVFKFGITPYFMEDYIKDDTLIMQLDPYHHDSFIHKKKHLVEAWCDTYNVKCTSVQPEIYLTPREIQFAKNKYARNRPIFLIQTNGGAGNPGEVPYSWARDLPINQAQQIVDMMNDTHYVMHIRKPEQLALNNCEAVSAPLREIFGLILMSDKRLFIDSFPFHCASAFNLPSTVCFIGTKPEVYSYPLNTNIIPKDKGTFIHTIDKYMEDAPWAGEKMYECPYDVNNMFSITQIFESIKKQASNPNSFVLPPQISSAQNQPANSPNHPQNASVANQNQTKQAQLALGEVGNFIDDYFDKIYVINLDKRTDRWKDVQMQLANANIHTAKRMPGVLISEKDLKKIPKEFYSKFRLETVQDKKKFEKKYIAGAIGCRRAHLKCIEDAKKNNYKKILIIEDDVVINPTANLLFFKIIMEIGDNWDMLYFGGDYWDNSVTFQTTSYALDSKLFNLILNNAEKSGEEFDFFYVKNVQSNYNVLRATPVLMVQSKSDSDIPTMELKPKMRN